MSAKPPVAPEALTAEFGSFGPAADRLRLTGLDHAARVHAGRAGAAARRVALIEARRPEETAELAAAEARLARETRATDGIAAGVVRAEIESATPVETAAVVHGLLLGDADLIAAKLTVAAIRSDGSVRRFTCADAKGYFRMDLPAGTDDEDRTVFLQVSDADQAVLYRGDEAIATVAGSVSFRRIELSGDRLAPCPIPPDRATMPRLLDLPESEALAVLGRLGLELGQRATQPVQDRAGLVISQEPPVGTPVDSSTTVTLVIGVVDDGTTVAVPRVIGTNLDQASATLAGAELGVGSVQERPNGNAAPGTVLTQSPAPGTRVATGSRVDLVLAVAPPDPRVRVPDLTGRTPEAARAALTEARLGLGRTTFRDDDRVGLVIDQNPDPNALAAPNTAVSIVIGRQPAPERVEVPALLRRTLPAAREILASVNLSLGEVSGDRAGVVVEQQPEPGTAVAIGSAVNVTLRGTGQPGGGGVVVAETGAFTSRLTERAASDAAFDAAGVDPQRLRAVLNRAGVRDADGVAEIVELDNAAIRDMFGLSNLNQARSLRRILREAAAETR